MSSEDSWKTPAAGSAQDEFRDKEVSLPLGVFFKEGAITMVREVHMSWDSDNPIPDELERASWDLDDSTLFGPESIDDVVNDRRKKKETRRKKKRKIEEKDHGTKKVKTV